MSGSKSKEGFGWVEVVTLGRSSPMVDDSSFPYCSISDLPSVTSEARYQR